jgi:hypothetical protein
MYSILLMVIYIYILYLFSKHVTYCVLLRTEQKIFLTLFAHSEIKPAFPQFFSFCIKYSGVESCIQNPKLTVGFLIVSRHVFFSYAQ